MKLSTSLNFFTNACHLVSQCFSKTTSTGLRNTGNTDGNLPRERTFSSPLIIPPHPRNTCAYSSSSDHIIHVYSILKPDAQSGFKDSSIPDNGWILNFSSQLVFWVPSWNHSGLCWPRNSFDIGQDVVSVKLDLHNFVHSDLWQDCKA